MNVPEHARIPNPEVRAQVAATLAVGMAAPKTSSGRPDARKAELLADYAAFFEALTPSA